MKYDLFCFGRANTDYVAEISDDKIIEEFGLARGTGTIVSYEIIDELEKILKNARKIPGGGAANVAAGFANISRKKGLKTAFAGAVGTDENGEKFQKSTKDSGVDCHLTKIEGKSPVCVVLITPDKERTFAVAPCVATLYEPKDLPYDAIKESKIFHTDAYELFTARDAVMEAIRFSEKSGNRVSFDLANEKIIEKERIEILKTLMHTDILFANEKEFTALIGEKQSLEKIAEEIKAFKKIETVVLKYGEKGAYVISDKPYRIEPYKTKVIDTNGAGDAFASGFLYGITAGYDKEFSGKLGSYYASKIVSQIGPRLEKQIENLEKEITGIKEKGI